MSEQPSLGNMDGLFQGLAIKWKIFGIVGELALRVDISCFGAASFLMAAPAALRELREARGRGLQSLDPDHHPPLCDLWAASRPQNKAARFLEFDSLLFVRDRRS